MSNRNDNAGNRLHRKARRQFTNHRAFLIGDDGRDVLPRNKVGRNSPCPCESGKKFKRCCGTNTQPTKED